MRIFIIILIMLLLKQYDIDLGIKVLLLFPGILLAALQDFVELVRK